MKYAYCGNNPGMITMRLGPNIKTFIKSLKPGFSFVERLLQIIASKRFENVLGNHQISLSLRHNLSNIKIIL